MQKINFVNNSTPALNAANLNQLQDNVANSLEVFENDFETHSGVSNVDANNYKTNGIYYLGTGCQNVPSNWIKLIVCGGHDVSQLAIKVNGTEPLMYFRTYDGSNWSGWQLVNAVYEAGSNTNGNYRKYADGTMICWNQISVQDQAINSTYGSLYQGTRTITFPAEFITDPVVTCSQFQWGTSASWGSVVSTSTTGATIRGIDAISRATGTNCVIGWYAIGRWKWL